MNAGRRDTLGTVRSPLFSDLERPCWFYVIQLPHSVAALKNHRIFTNFGGVLTRLKEYSSSTTNNVENRER